MSSVAPLNWTLEAVGVGAPGGLLGEADGDEGDRAGVCEHVRGVGEQHRVLCASDRAVELLQRGASVAS
jgi:hypothetical protein